MYTDVEETERLGGKKKIRYWCNRVARNFFCGSLFLPIGQFLCLAGTNFCDFL